jgi:hypothetical protein
VGNLFDEPNYAQIKKLIVERYRNQDVTIEDLGNFVVAETPFLRTHFKKQILRPMEQEQELKVVSAKEKRRRGTFPDGTTIRIF